MNNNTLIATLIILICFGSAFFVYFNNVSNLEIENSYVSNDENKDNNFDVEDMYFPVSLIQELNDSSLNGEVFDEIESKKYLNKRFGFSFFVSNEMKLANETSELWRRDGGENFVKHYLRFYFNSDKRIIFNSEITPYNNLKEWEKTDEGNYRLYSDIVAEPIFKNIYNAEAIVFDSREFNTYDVFLIKNNVLYEIGIDGLSKDEREKFLNSIEFFAPVK